MIPTLAWALVVAIIAAAIVLTYRSGEDAEQDEDEDDEHDHEDRDG